MAPEERIRLAEEFLQEAVFRSRAKQAGSAAIANAGCGLGERAEVELELSPRAAELFPLLFGDASDVVRVRAGVHEWVERQDALDRKRNHFLKAFRQAHGFDRAAYGPERLAEFEQGLERINAEVAAARRDAARRLLS